MVFSHSRNLTLLASLDSSESAKLIYWVYVGQMTSVRSSSQQRFHPLPVGGSSPNFQDILVVWSSWCPSLFLVKKFLGSKVTAQKGVKRLKSISSYSFWARMFIYSGCVVLPKAENCMSRNFDLGPQNFTKNFWKWSKFWTFLLFELEPQKFRVG